MKRIVGLVWVLALGAAGCGGGQTANCQKYLQCLEAVSGQDASQAVVDDYGPNGTCWRSSDLAAACDDVCEFGLTGQRASHPDVAECR